MLRCSKCNEEQPETFELCWNCRTVREGLERQQTVEPVMPRGDSPLPATEADSTSVREGTPPRRPDMDNVHVEPRQRCVKCDSTDILRRLSTYGYRGEANYVVVHEDPGAVFLTGSHFGELKANVCGRCGFTELYADNLPELREAYRKSQEKRFPT